MACFKRTIPSFCYVLLLGFLVPVQGSAACTGDGSADDPSQCLAETETTAAGSKAGALADTWSSNDQYEVLTEQDETIGPPPKRCDYLDQRWHFELPGAGNWKLVVEGYRDDVGADGDDFRFFLSADNASFTPAGLVIDSAGDATYESTVFAASAGPFTVRVADSDCSRGHRNNASLSIDHLYMESIVGTPPPPPPPAGGSQVPIIGYYTNWSQYGRNFCINNIEGESDCSSGSITGSSADFVTHIKYAFFQHDASGAIFSGDEFSDHNKSWGNEGATCDGFPDAFGKKGNLCQLKILKQNYPHIQTLLSIGGWTWSNDFSEIYEDANKHIAHCDSILWYLENYDIDGIDIDWEYPGVQGEGDNVVRSCHGHEGDPVATDSCDAENFRDFVNYCGPRLHDAGKLLTMALACDPHKYNDFLEPPVGEDPGELDLDGMISQIDWIDLMSYDMKGPWSPVTGHHSGLHSNGDEGTYFPDYPESEFNIASCVEGYVANGVPPEKLAVGVPVYGHSWKGIEDKALGDPPVQGLFNTHTGVPKGTWDGGQWGTSGVFDYEDIVRNIEPGAITMDWDDSASAATLTWRLKGKNGKGFMSYVDPAGICDRADYVLDNRAFGMMFWEFSGDIEDDDRSLIQAMYCAFNPEDTKRCPEASLCP